MISASDRKVLSASTASDGSGTDFSLDDLWKILRKHRLLILICALTGFLAATLYVRVATPIYEASASLRIDPSRSSSLGLENMFGRLGSDASLMKTEAALLASDEVALSAMTSLDDADFQSLAGVSRSQANFPADFAGSASRNKQLTGQAQTLSVEQEMILGRVVRALKVKPVEGTQLMAISFRNKNPKLAATFVNHVIAAYLRISFDSRYSSMAQVQDWLSEQLETLKVRAGESQKHLAEFQKQNSLIGTDASNNTMIDRLRQLNERLAGAQADRLVREAQMRAAQAANVETLATLYPNVGIQTLQQQQAQLYARYADLSVKFGENYPPLAQLTAERKLVDQRLDQLIKTVRDQLQQGYQVARDTEALLQKQADEQTSSVYQLYGKQAEYAILMADATASRDLYDRLQYQLQQAGVTAGLSAVNTTLVTTARTPHYPVEPKKLLIVAGATISGLLVGLVLSFILASRVHLLQSPQEVEVNLGLPILAVIPRFAAQTNTETQKRQPISAAEPNSRGSEAFRTLRNSILLSQIDNPPKSILVTSSLEAEGKSTVAANYAVVLAQHGEGRVLLVDCDLRRPTQHIHFGVPNQRGLSDIIVQEQTDTIKPLQPVAALPNLDLLPAGGRVQFASEALGSARFLKLLRQWEEEYDFVVLDSPPILVVSDSLPLAKFANAMLLVTRYDRTPEKAARRSVSMLQRVGANLLGAVINDIPQHDKQYGAYYGYGYYDQKD